MKRFAAVAPEPRLDDDTLVAEELIGRLHRATENTIFDLTSKLSARERASLAVFCYHKSHLRRIGLAIAATCDQTFLVRQFGTVLANAMLAQSQEAGAEFNATRLPQRPKITLARSAREPISVSAGDAGDDKGSDGREANEGSEGSDGDEIGGAA
jgi:hypothetical protein